MRSCMKGIFRKEKKKIGVVIDQSLLRFVGVKKEGLLSKIFHHGDIEVPDTVLKNGKIHNIDAFITVLKKLREIAGDGKYVVGLPVGAVRAHTLQIPLDREYSQKEMREIIQKDATSYITFETDMHIDNTTIEYSPYYVTPRNFVVSMVIFNKQSQKEYRIAFKKAGIKNVSFTSGLAMYSEYAPYFNESPKMLVNFGEFSVQSAMVQDGIILCETYSDVGFGEMIDSIKKNSQISRDYARSHLFKNGIFHPEYNPATQMALNNALMNTIKEVYKGVSDWNYPKYKRVYQKKPISEIVLVGDGSTIRGLAQVLGEATGCKVYRGSLVNYLANKESYAPSIHSEHAPLYDLACSLALHK